MLGYTNRKRGTVSERPEEQTGLTDQVTSHFPAELSDVRMTGARDTVLYTKQCFKVAVDSASSFLLQNLELMNM